MRGRPVGLFIVQVRRKRSSPILVQVPVNTWEAYNGWGGKSLYDSAAPTAPAEPRLVRASYHWICPGARGRSAGSCPSFGSWSARLRRLLPDRLETSFDPDSLLQHRLVMTAGHDEYWTKEMRDAFQAARDSGTNLAFIGANAGYWQVRYENGGETIVGYKSLYDPNPDASLKTAMFRELTPPRYECELVESSIKASASTGRRRLHRAERCPR